MRHAEWMESEERRFSVALQLAREIAAWQRYIPVDNPNGVSVLLPRRPLTACEAKLIENALRAFDKD